MKNFIFVFALLLAGWFWPMGQTALAADFHATTAQEFQTALSTAQNNGQDDIIYLDAGTYAGRFTFVTAESFALIVQPETGLNPGQVVLDAEALGRPFYLNGSGNAVPITIQGLVIQNGQSGHGSGMLINGTTGTIRVSECIIQQNAVDSTSSWYGGGLYVDGTGNDVFITDNIIKNNDNRGNSYNRGGGVYVENSDTLTFSGNTISENFARDSGGGLYIHQSNEILIKDNSIDNNETNSRGGGIYVRGTNTNTLVVLNNKITNNHAYGGSAIHTEAITASITIENNDISLNTSTNFGAVYIGNNTQAFIFKDNQVNNNNADSDGNNAGNYGALYLYSATLVEITGNTFSGNTAAYTGGGYIVEGGNPQMVVFNNNIVSNNTATANNYGGFYFRAATTSMEISNNLVYGNRALNGYVGGLGISCGGTTDFINNTIVGNSATDYGGGVTLWGGVATVNAYNNIVWGNIAPTGADIYLTGSGTKNGYNNNYHTMEGLWSFAGSNIDVAPLFVNETGGDYYLGAGSLCLNAGDNTAPNLPAIDLGGNDRIADVTVDMGAYEHSTAIYHPADLDQNWIIGNTEYVNYSDAWKNGETWAVGSNPIPIDHVTRAGYLSQQSDGHYHNQGGGQPGCWVTGQ